MIGMNLKALRKAKGYSQEEVAEKINVSRQSVAKWENEESIPDVIKCSELANLYEISLDELVHDKISVEEESTNSEDGKYVFGIVKVGERGQIVIPKHARDVFDIKPGDKLLVVGDIKRGLGIGKVSRSIASDFVFGNEVLFMLAIKTENLTKKYKDKVAVNSINLSINKGEIYGLLGVNGAGKSTTIKMLSCLIKPTSGDAVLNGYSIVNDSEDVKRIINVSPQETAVAPNLTVRENLELIAEIYGFEKETAVQKAQNMIDDFELAEVAKSKAKTLSGGWQRRLSIAMALISDPEILFLDEPTLGLDVLARRELWNKISALKGKITVILTTHYLEEAESLSDRIGIMVKGNLVAEGTADELKNSVNATSFEDAFVKIAEEGK